jgi:Bacterial toxin 24
MKLLLKMLLFILTIFQANICEAKVVVFDAIVSKIFVSIDEAKNVNESTSISENDFDITCKSEGDLVDYRNFSKCCEANAAKGGGSLVDDAANLVKMNGGKNSVTIETATQKIRYDLAGKAHGGVPTPHMQVYNKNFVDGVQKNVSRESKEAIPMTQKDLDLVRKHLTGQ